MRILPGIIGWLRLGGLVPSVPGELVTELIRRSEAINQSGGLWTRFQRGQMVRVVSDKIDALAEVLEEPRSPKDRVRVLLQFMGRMVSAQVHWGHLQALQETEYIGDTGRGGRRTRGAGRWIRGFGPRAAAPV